MKKQNIEAIYRLSPLQEGLLYHMLYHSDSSTYSAQLIISLQGILNETYLRKAWEKTIRRHGIMRALIVWKGYKHPLQVIRHKVEIPWKQLDWIDLPSLVQKEKFSNLLERDCRQGFVLKEAPLMRFILVRLATDYYHFIWSFHHILLDGWCWSIILDEVFSIYEALVKDLNIVLPEPRPYKDYIAWLQCQDLDVAKTFWQNELKGFSRTTPLLGNQILDNRHHQDGEMHKCGISISGCVTTELNQFAKRNKLTLSAIVYGAWSLILSRYANTSDIVFGATVSGRPADLPGSETMIGLFINTLPFRVSVSDQMLLLAWLRQIHQISVRSQEFGYAPLSKIREWSNIPKNMSLFESIVGFENYPRKAYSEQEYSNVKLVDIHANEQPDYPIGIAVVPSSDLIVNMWYNSEMFSREQVSMVLGRFHTVFEMIVKDSVTYLSDISLLDLKERHQLINEWNRSGPDYPISRCINELMTEQVRSSPDAIVLVCGESQLTYRQLGRYSDGLGAMLNPMGVAPDVLVGLCIDRSLELIISILGILKSGGGYLPLDTTYPKERLKFMIQDADVSVILTQERYRELFSDEETEIICVDTCMDKLLQERDNRPYSIVSPDNIAYCMYTSGSTGNPKGTVVTHRNIVRLVKNSNYVEFSNREIFIQFAPISFDASTFEIWGSLLNGGRLVLVSESKISLELLGQILIDYGVTTVWLTAGLFHLMVDNCIDSFRYIRQLLAGGDVLSVSHVKKLLSAGYDLRLINGYGPTECTTFSCCYSMDSSTEIVHSVPIGRPISNTQVYILDDDFHVVPVGVSGELYIAGDGLSRCYCGDSFLTSEKFVPNIFDSDLGTRLYKSGDSCRYLPDSTIEYLGRKDYQIKIRGHRIELGEIESVLLSNPSVSECVVLVFGDTSDKKYLVAYIIFHADKGVDISTLRAFLQERVPDYMIPSSFVSLDSFPLTANGKIDRQALPEPDNVRPDWVSSYIAPMSSIEKLLAKIWKQVLGVNQVSIHDNFFELGGDSIKAIRIFSIIGGILHIDVPLRILLQSNDLSDFSERLIEIGQDAGLDVGEIAELANHVI